MKKNLTLFIVILFFARVTCAELVKDINPGKPASSPAIMGIVPGGFVFYCNSPAAGQELWFSDGTTAGTKMIKDINPGPSGSGTNTLFIQIGNSWFFVARQTFGTWSLWKTDGTVAGTIMMKDLGSIPISLPLIPMVACNSMLYFSYENPVFVDGKELWKCDGTAAGTSMVKDINPGGNSDPSGLTALGNQVYFFANNGINGNELWKSDGTAAGTSLVKDIYTESISSFPFTAPSIMVFKNKLYFGAQGTHDEGVELYVSDGTGAGTQLLMDINISPTASAYPAFLFSAQNFLVFRANDGTSGTEPWITDGTKAGTKLLKDISAGTANSIPSGFSALGNKLIFNATTADKGNELWITDGTTTGTSMLKDINDGAGSSYPSEKITVNGRLFFSATDSTNGTEMWVSDGTVAGTRLYADVNPGKTGSSILRILPMDSELFFSAIVGNDSLGNELYKLRNNLTGIARTNNVLSKTSVYPNPCQAGYTLHIQNPGILNYTVTMVSQDGKLISEK